MADHAIAWFNEVYEKSDGVDGNRGHNFDRQISMEIFL